MKLSEIINKSKGIVDYKFKINDPLIESIEYDSRKIKKGRREIKKQNNELQKFFCCYINFHCIRYDYIFQGASI